MSEVTSTQLQEVYAKQGYLVAVCSKPYNIGDQLIGRWLESREELDAYRWRVIGTASIQDTIAQAAALGLTSSASVGDLYIYRVEAMD